nr:hypothetical protein [Tanacetum cinerariifolium]
MVDFVEASPLRIETTDEGTKIIATVDGILRTIIESSLKRNLELQDEEGISSLPDTELFENLTLMGYNISLNQKFTFQKGQFFHQWKYLIHTIMQCLSPKSTRFNEFSSNIATALGEGSGTLTEPYHTPSPKAQSPSHTTHSSSTLPPVTTTFIPPITLTDTPPIMQYTSRTRIAQSSVLPPVADEHASPLRDVSQGEACPTDSGFIADQVRKTIAKSSTLPYDSTPRVTSHAAAEGKLLAKFQAQEVEVNRLKERVKLLEDREGVAIEGSRDDAPIKGRNLDEGEAAAERASDDTEEMATVLTSMDAATVLASGLVEVPIGSGSIPTAGPPAAEVPTGKSKTPKKQKVQEQIDAQVARELEEQLEKEDQRMSEQIARDAEVKKLKDFIPMGSKEEVERFKRKGTRFKQESTKKLKTSEEVPEEVNSPDVVSLEKVHTEGQRSYWKITRLGGSSASYQFFIDILKHLDREDLNQL